MYVHLLTPKGTIFHIWRQRNNAFVNDDISSRHHDYFQLGALIDLVYLPIFQSSFPKYTQAYMSLSTEVFMLKNNNISLQYCLKKCLIFSDSDINHIKVENKITAFSLNLKAFFC